MALFPTVRFELLLPDGGITAGHTANGILVVASDEAVPRADHIAIELVSTITIRRPRPTSMVLFRTQLRLELPGGIVAGVHRFPFALEAPAMLPPSFHDALVDITHAVRVRLDVAWARDPAVDAYPKLALAPRAGQRTATRVRLPLELQDADVELGLDSTSLVQGEPVLGFVRLHRGTLEPFEGLRLNLVSEMTNAVAGKWERVHASEIITEEQLRGGGPVHFELPGASAPSFHGNALGHSVKIGIHPHGDFVSFRPATTHVPLEIFPLGSMLSRSDEPRLDLGRRSARVANATGLREGTGSLLVEGEPDGISLRMRSVPVGRGAEVEVELAYPARRVGSALFAAVHPEPFADVEVRVTDRALFLRSRRANDSVEELVALAQHAIAHAAKLAAAIRSLPFPSALAATENAWHACAMATGAFLVPSVPALDGLVFHRILATQEERRFTASIATVWDGATPRDRVAIELGDARLPEPAMVALANGVFPDALAMLRETFTAIHSSSNGGLVLLERDAWSTDPRVLLPALEAVIDWVLRERGENRSGSPYR